MNSRMILQLLKWCAYDSEFTPNTLDSRFKDWIAKGITALCSVMTDEKLLSFETLKRTQLWCKWCKPLPCFLRLPCHEERYTIPYRISLNVKYPSRVRLCFSDTYLRNGQKEMNINHKLEKFASHWENWVKYVMHHRPDFIFTNQ